MKDTITPGHLDVNAEHRKLHEMIGDIEVAMMTCHCSDGSMRSRPLMSQKMDQDDVLWFITSKNADYIQDIEPGHPVNLAYASPKDSRYVSISGQAEVVRDDLKLRELWSPVMKAWYPQGIEDPSLVLLKVRAVEGSYWDAPAGKMVQFLKIVKAALTGHEYAAKKSEHSTVDLSHKYPTP